MKDNKLVLISGSGRGVGASIARSFVEKDYQVAINFFQNEKQAKLLTKELGKTTSAFYADIRNKEDVVHMIKSINKKFGRSPEILVNNAMADFLFNGDARSMVNDITYGEILNHLDVSIKGSLNLIQEVIPQMEQKNFGRIINIGTNLFHNPVVPYHDYVIAKAALLGLTRTFAKDLGPKGITVNMVSGGLLKITDASAATPEEVFNIVASMTPLQKVTTTKDFSDAITFFASNDSRAITGQNLTVDGGLTFS